MRVSPTISVLMPAYNAKEHIAEAVRSVLEQSFADFELIVVNDGSTDETLSILSQFESDNRLRIVQNSLNIGLIETLTRGLVECSAPLIARMDADDICDRRRFERQVAFLSENPDIDIVGGAIRFFGNISKSKVFQFPATHHAIHPSMLFFCPLAHPAIMFRKKLVEDNLYRFDDAFRHAEDYELWSRLLLEVRAANLPDVVLNYRLHKSQVSVGQANHQYDASMRVRKKLLDQAGIVCSDEEFALHESVIIENVLPRHDYFEELAAWFLKLEHGNEISMYWDPLALHELLRRKFVETAQRAGFSMKALSKRAHCTRFFTLRSAGDSYDISLASRLYALLRRVRDTLQ